MKAITIHPVWAWAIVHGYKPVENRTWKTTHRGPLLIHASAASPAAKQSDAGARAILGGLGIAVPEVVPTAALVGIVRVTSVLRKQLATADRYLESFDPPTIDLAAVANHPLATGPWCWVLREPLIFRPPISLRGQQGLFDVPTETISREIARLGISAR